MAEKAKILSPPLGDAVVSELVAGDRVMITGTIYTGRDAAHKRMVELLDRGEKLPFDIKGSIIYYVGPTPAPPGRPIGSAGPTTSGRMDTYAPRLIELGLKAMIGKGGRSDAVIQAMKKQKAVYLGATGGAGALLSRAIRKCEIVAWEDLGPEAVRRLEVVEFPVVVINDVRGGDLYKSGQAKYRRNG